MLQKSAIQALDKILLFVFAQFQFFILIMKESLKNYVFINVLYGKLINGKFHPQRKNWFPPPSYTVNIQSFEVVVVKKIKIVFIYFCNQLPQKVHTQTHGSITI